MVLVKNQPWYAAANSQRLTSISLILIAIIATVDSFIVPAIGLELLYLVPLATAAAFASRWQLLVLSAICTAFAEGFSFTYTEAWLVRVIFIFAGYAFVALLVREMVVYRRAAARRIEDLQQELSLLETAAQESELLVNSSPLGILTLSYDGKIVSSNRAAHEFLAVEAGGLTGQPIGAYLYGFDDVHRGQGTAVVDFPGKRANGEEFRARVWTSTFGAGENGATTAVVIASLQ